MRKESGPGGQMFEGLSALVVFSYWFTVRVLLYALGVTAGIQKYIQQIGTFWESNKDWHAHGPALATGFRKC